MTIHIFLSFILLVKVIISKKNNEHPKEIIANKGFISFDKKGNTKIITNENKIIIGIITLLKKFLNFIHITSFLN